MVPAANSTGKSRTTVSNDLVVTNSSSVAETSAKPKKGRKNKSLDNLEAEDDSAERNAFMASPLKGGDARKLANACV